MLFEACHSLVPWEIPWLVPWEIPSLVPWVDPGLSNPSGPLMASEQMIFLREPRDTLILKRSELSMSHRRLLVAFSKDDGLCWMISIVRLQTKMMFLVG